MQFVYIVFFVQATCETSEPINVSDFTGEGKLCCLETYDIIVNNYVIFRF